MKAELAEAESRTRSFAERKERMISRTSYCPFSRSMLTSPKPKMNALRANTFSSEGRCWVNFFSWHIFFAAAFSSSLRDKFWKTRLFDMIEGNKLKMLFLSPSCFFSSQPTPDRSLSRTHTQRVTYAAKKSPPYSLKNSEKMHFFYTSIYFKKRKYLLIFFYKNALFRINTAGILQ